MLGVPSPVQAVLGFSVGGGPTGQGEAPIAPYLASLGQCKEHSLARLRQLLGSAPIPPRMSRAVCLGRDLL